MARRRPNDQLDGSMPSYTGGGLRHPPGARDRRLDHARAIVSLAFGPIAERTFDVRYWDGSVDHNDAGFTQFRLGINRPGALRRMLLRPSELSIVESYLSGDIDIDGGFESAMGLADQIGEHVRSPRVLARLVRHLLALPSQDAVDDVRVARSEAVVERVGKPHDPTRDRAAIQFHYDVGNDFYQLWLDEQMVYSCAYYHDPSDSLEEAQRAKLDLICRKLRLRPGHRLLDVGCGWGALIMHASRHYGVTAVGITLSDAQATLARERIAAAGLADRCRVEIRDYRALPPDAHFDRISSVGMIEHVGQAQLRAYFDALHRALVPGGLLLNHGITSMKEAHPRGPLAWLEGKLWQRDAFIHQYVFPDGKLTAYQSVIAAAEAAGFETRDTESLREHYALTLRAWVARLVEQHDRAVALTSERIFRIWRLYMTASAYAFVHARINVLQTLLAKPDAKGRVELPMTREDLLSE
jgi:cyclopropane-fatty-acyl-phospholipid synthase